MCVGGKGAGEGDRDLWGPVPPMKQEPGQGEEEGVELSGMDRGAGGGRG